MASSLDISVVIPIYNGSKFLVPALDSIQAQPFNVTEVIVVDDGSSDNGADLAKAHALAPKVLVQDNRGPASARNRGIKTAQGQMIAFLDQDDLWRPDKLTLQSAAFEQDPTLEICFGKVDYFWEDPECEEAQHFKGHQRTTAVSGFVTTTMLAKRSVFDTVGYFDETKIYADSIEWCAKMQDIGVNFRMLDDVVLDHRRHDTNMTLRRKQSTSEILAFLHKRKQDAAARKARDETK